MKINRSILRNLPITRCGLLWALIPFAIGIASPTDSFANAYAIGAESVTGLGRADAGSAALASDPSIAHSNPAGMVYLHGREIMTGLTLVYPEVDFKPGVSTLFDGSALSGTGGGSAGPPALVPNTHLVMPISDTLVAGLSITGQYGLVSDYHPGFVGRYDLINANLFSVNLNPSVAWKVNDDFAVGAGLNLAYGRQKLRQAVDFGSLCGASLGTATCAAGFGLVPGASDGLARGRFDDWATGFNVGVIYNIKPETRIGVSYRSKLTFNGQGHSRFDVPDNAAAFLTAAGASAVFQNSDTASKFYFPATASLAIAHQATPKLNLSAGLTWHDWSVVKESRIVSDNPAASDSVSILKYRDSFRLATGLEYAFSDTLLLRAGVAFQQTPVRDSQREPAVPDSDRIILAVGASHALSDRITMDVGYQFHNLTDGPVERVSVTGSTTRGTYDITAHFFAMGVRVRF